MNKGSGGCLPRESVLSLVGVFKGDWSDGCLPGFVSAILHANKVIKAYTRLQRQGYVKKKKKKRPTIVASLMLQNTQEVKKNAI